jgi:formylglycine-generating enzyme required for sulfatase activity
MKTMVKNHRAIQALPIAALILLLALAASLVSGQGGTGKDANANSNKKVAPKPKTTPRKPAKTTGSTIVPKKTTPAFRPTNPKIELVKIAPGSFMMGSTKGSVLTGGEVNEKPVHQVTINYSFYMGKYEVTQAQWQAVMGNNPSLFKDCGNCPVEQVSWNDAQEFIEKLNPMNDGYTYRLPTEAEWDYACRAGTTGDYAGNMSEMAWDGANSGNKTHAVGSKQTNAWGLADMLGNVWEWCEDWYHETYYGAPIDGSAWLSGGEQKYRVLRGGGFNIQSSYLSSARGNDPPDRRLYINGFRVVAVARTQ